MARRRWRSVFRGILLLAGPLVAGGAMAATALDGRPFDPLALEQAERFEALARQIGWGALLRTERMARADTAYGPGPVLAVTATPGLPALSFLESRAWAAERFLDEAAADRRLEAIRPDPGSTLLFDLLLIGTTPEALGAERLEVIYEDDHGQRHSGALEGYAITLEPTLGGALHAGRGRLRIDLPEGHDWALVEGISLRLLAAGQAFDLVWRFPPPD